MNQAELIKALALATEATQTHAKAFLEALGNIIAGEAKNGEGVVLPVIGRFVSKQSAERKCRNPRTGEEMIVPAKRKLTFSPSSHIKSLLEGKA